jgi:hypothetical protein
MYINSLTNKAIGSLEIGFFEFFARGVLSSK